jgi:hypothetical protein
MLRGGKYNHISRSSMSDFLTRAVTSPIIGPSSGPSAGAVHSGVIERGDSNVVIFCNEVSRDIVAAASSGSAPGSHDLAPETLFAESLRYLARHLDGGGSRHIVVVTGNSGSDSQATEATFRELYPHSAVSFMPIGAYIRYLAKTATTAATTESATSAGSEAAVSRAKRIVDAVDSLVHMLHHQIRLCEDRAVTMAGLAADRGNGGDSACASLYPPHLSLQQMRTGLADGSLLMGKLRAVRSFRDGTVAVSRGGAPCT